MEKFLLQSHFLTFLHQTLSSYSGTKNTQHIKRILPMTLGSCPRGDIWCGGMGGVGVGGQN